MKINLADQATLYEPTGRNIYIISVSSIFPRISSRKEIHVRRIFRSVERDLLGSEIDFEGLGDRIIPVSVISKEISTVKAHQGNLRKKNVNAN